MSATYQIPGVYIEEQLKIPASITAVDTAIPVFVGFTEKSVSDSGEENFRKPLRISSMMEYKKYFGGPPQLQLNVTLSKKHKPQFCSLSSPLKYPMYYALQHFFDNGGSVCYVFSTGSYPAAPPSDASCYDDSNDDSALNLVKQIDEVTLLVFPDLATLGEQLFYEVYNKALQHCAKQKDRFLIMDVFPRYKDNNIDISSSITALCEQLQTASLNYGAAYFPNLATRYHPDYAHSNICFSEIGGLLDGVNSKDVMVLLTANALGQVLLKSITHITSKNRKSRLLIIAEALETMFVYVPHQYIKAAVNDAINKVKDSLADDRKPVDESTRLALTDMIKLFKDKANQAIVKTASHVLLKNNSTEANVILLKRIFTKTFQGKLDALISGINLELPPSAAIAGVYATVDRNRGVWKSPTAISLQAVVQPVLFLDDTQQQYLHSPGTNISINAIRSFPAKGVLVWGAGTLDGNSNEWKYVPVRRFFLMIEESISKGLQSFTFEPNDANTWTSVKNMINNFLVQQWRNGALLGTKPEEAFFVRVGLNETMTEQDLMEGRMIVEIGMAPIRPAEFIIIRISIGMCAGN